MAKTLFSNWLSGRFTILLVLLPLCLLLAPLLGESLVGRFVLNVFLTLLLLSGVYAAGLKPKEKMAAWILVIVGVSVRWAGHTTGIVAFNVAGDILAALFFGYVTVALFLYVIRAVRVDMNVLSAALCVYLLLGMTFALLYTGLDLVNPSSFAIPEDIKGQETSKFIGRIEDFVYFSLVTMTTTGYGDIRPVSHVARSLTILEILIGQLYLVVMIARLVSSWGTGSSSKQ